MNNLRPFRFWCQKVLPLVYDDELSYYELLCKVVDYLNKTIENVNSLSENFDELVKMFNTLKEYVNNYFKNLDVQEEINKKLDEMASNGTLKDLINGWVTPEMYGAIGDGVTDDSDAFQKMFNDIKDNTQIVLKARNYYISKPLLLRKNEIRISGQFVRSEYSPALVTDFTNGTLLTVTGYGFSASNIVIRTNLSVTPTTETTTGILFNRDSVDADGNIDAILSNVTIMRFATGCSIIGRNVNIHECGFTENRVAIIIDKIEVITEQRGIIIDNCRFHYGIIAVQNKMRLKRENSVFLKNCFCDGMQTLFSGYGNGCVINNNYCTTMVLAGTYISIRGDNDNNCPLVISNNVLNGSKTKSYMIFLDNAVRVAIIKNNTFMWCTNSCINISGLNTGFSVEITGNTFYMCAENYDSAIINTNAAQWGFIVNNYITNSTTDKQFINFSGQNPNSRLIKEPNYQTHEN